MQSIDLTICDQEPIHIPGAIQPHGVLLVIDPVSEKILQVAGDTDGLLGLESPPLGRQVGDLLVARFEALARSAGITAGNEPAYLGSVRLAARSGEIDVVAHDRDGVVLLELELTPEVRPSAARLLAVVRAVAASLEAAPDLPRACQAAAREIRSLIGFDRVMVYRFLEDGSGCVLAEDKAAELSPFLNHHYPASDIPRQARELYLRNPIRVIPDVNYVPAPLMPQLCSSTGRPLDMSDCALRSVSPVHLQYLRNMGVSASMSVSIVRDGVLWGLVACHHTAPRLVPYELREACRHVGQILSQQIAAREEAEAHIQARRLAEVRDELLLVLARTDNVEDALAEHAADLRTVLPSDGMAICRRGEVIASFGHRPSDTEIADLACWLLREGAPELYSTDRLSERHAPASSYRAQASGLLAAVISREEPLVLLWFRAERLEVINWAGNPHKPAEPGTIPGVLTPRASFAVWREAVHGRSRPWTAAELDAARRFRRAVFDLGRQQRLEELNRRLRQTLSDKEELIVQKDLLMGEVHHRVQNSLQLVNSMLGLQEREVADPVLAAHFAEARRRLLAVSAVHRRLWRSDHVQSVSFDTYLRELRDGLVEGWGPSWDRNIGIRAAPVLVPTDTAVVLALVVTELLTNAVKHAYRGASGPIDVTVGRGSSGSIRITVADQGTGMLQEERPGGFGWRLTRTLVAQVKGEIAFQDNKPGTRVVLTVPLPAHFESHPEAEGHRPLAS
ncbi:GAF domain-containing protein [Dankookia rubra]|uniref:GAF domain-containing protein n=1 Tax=Dankookia rubra TaxID=1442381 RepID=A0A4R5Q9T2_9PROT|nr:histidine kinase dimerization/phosphoacceptor domain -containing protein [Dankookia rubra]TDH59091.1 GAF domain-containing protein [Dankookia rubra]